MPTSASRHHGAARAAPRRRSRREGITEPEALLDAFKDELKAGSRRGRPLAAARRRARPTSGSSSASTASARRPRSARSASASAPTRPQCRDGRRRHVPGRRREQLGDVGRAGRGGPRPRQPRVATRPRSSSTPSQRAAARGRRPRARRHRRPPAHQGQPDGGAAQGSAGRRPRAGQRDRGAAGARRDHRAERPRPGAGVHRGGRRHRRRADQARRLGQGRHRRSPSSPSSASRSSWSAWGRRPTISSTSIPTSSWRRCSRDLVLRSSCSCPVRIALGEDQASVAKLGYRTGRLLGYRRLFVFASVSRSGCSSRRYPAASCGPGCRSRFGGVAGAPAATSPSRCASS